MYIAPDSTIRILKNVPLDNTYRNTIYFSSESAQIAYFTGLTKFNQVKYTYQNPKEPGWIAINAEQLYDCNYVMFQNTSFGNKWFYAFITNVEYVNNETSYVQIELDVMQTWFFDYKVNPSFVVREHVIDDTIGANLVPEDLELGEYVADDFDGTGHLGAYSIVGAATVDENGDNITGGTYSGIYSGLYYNVFSNYQEVNEWIETLAAAQKNDAIVSIFMIPTDFVGTIGGGVKTYNITKTKAYGKIGTYTPKNNKLFTHPYNFLYVTDLAGNYAEYRYEFFEGGNCNFGMAGDMTCNPQVVLYPMNYKGIPANYNEKMSMEGFPQCPYATDTFKAWLAQNASSLSVSALGASFTAAAGAATGNPLLLAHGALGIAQTLTQVQRHAAMPRQAHGVGGSSAAVAMRIKDFAFMHMHIREEFARIIDDYFNAYGYAIHQIKVPNRSQRPHWNYVKLLNSNLTGSVPAPDMAKLRSIYDEGITFWKNGNEVGNYSLDNRTGGVVYE